jgi:hypothetical protein
MRRRQFFASVGRAVAGLAALPLLRTSKPIPDPTPAPYAPPKFCWYLSDDGDVLYGQGLYISQFRYAPGSVDVRPDSNWSCLRT